MAVLMKDAPPEAVDMVIKLMDFNPEKRLDIEAALKHPYMADFVTGSEPSCPGKCVSASRPILALLACLPPACLPAYLPACLHGVPADPHPASCLTRRLSIPIDDDHKFTVNDYRDKLYQQVVANRKDRTGRMAAYFGVKR